MLTENTPCILYSIDFLHALNKDSDKLMKFSLGKLAVL